MLEEPNSVMCFPPDRVIISFAMRKVQKLDYVLNVRSQLEPDDDGWSATRSDSTLSSPVRALLQTFADFPRVFHGVTDPLSGRCPEPMSFDV